MMNQQEQILKAINGSVIGDVRNTDADARVNYRQMRVGKVDFPKFNADNVDGWIHRCEHFFIIDETPDNEKLRCAVIHLEGDAIEWHKAFMKILRGSVADMPWADYVKAISARFSNAMFEDAMEEIAFVVQIIDDIDGLHDYNSGSDRLLNKVTIGEPYAVSLYVKGLKPGIKGPVKMLKPQTLHEAYGLARLQPIINTSLMNRLKDVKDGSQREDAKITPPINASELPLLPDPTTGVT
ncbi:uncharacterized protein LOC143613629 [Bidens hawaiensis]|uniref:uncharacterized protein LOC143613629 n=1 Tax=Bidens hawaiensis TaxID=980011 RepID=UPI004049A3B9